MVRENITVLENRHILLGVTGSIAIYKAVDLASKLTQAGAHVTVIMTGAAQRFVSPLTFESVTGRPAYTDMWRTGSGELPTHITHVGLGEDTDLLIIAPATANTLARLAAGLADDLLSVTALAARCPVIVAPAMDSAMYEHPATQNNLATLRARGIQVVEPEEGRFASGMVGRGRLPETPTLIGHIRRVLGRRGSLRGRRVIVTAGGTQEALDPVRYLANRSTGKQGYALAQAALDAGAEVTLISATSTLPVPIGATLAPVTSAQDMLAAVEAHLTGADVLIMAAAVADFRPAVAAERKIKKSADENQKLTIELVRTPDILLTVKRLRQETGWPRLAIGFAAESEDLETNARAKLEAKGLDLIVANDITAADAGFGADTNRVVMLDRRGRRQALELASKMRISEAIIARAAALLGREG